MYNIIKENLPEIAVDFIKEKLKINSRQENVKIFIFANEFNLLSGYKQNAQLTVMEIADLFQLSTKHIYKLLNQVKNEFKHYVHDLNEYKEVA